MHAHMDTHTRTYTLSMSTDRKLCVSVFVWLLLYLLQEKAMSIWESKDFFMELEPLPGGVEAVKEMTKMDK